MATQKQKTAAKKNIKKAQEKWQNMTPRQRAHAQPEGAKRKKPGVGGSGNFFRIEIRPKSQFTSFRTQDVGEKGGLERVAGHRKSGSWDTAAWLVSKDDAHVSTQGELVITDKKAKTVLQQIEGPITHVKGDIFKAKPKRNVPEKEKPTKAQRAAYAANIKKAQRAKRKTK